MAGSDSTELQTHLKPLGILSCSKTDSLKRAEIQTVTTMRGTQQASIIVLIGTQQNVARRVVSAKRRWLCEIAIARIPLHTNKPQRECHETNLNVKIQTSCCERFFFFLIDPTAYYIKSCALTQLQDAHTRSQTTEIIRLPLDPQLRGYLVVGSAATEVKTRAS